MPSKAARIIGCFQRALAQLMASRRAPTPCARLKELGIDISRQRSRMLTAAVVEEADYIFGMTHSHVDSINLLYPWAAEKTFLLREFDETLDIFEKDISDPIGGFVRNLLRLPRSNRAGPCVTVAIHRSNNRPARHCASDKTVVAIGSDHGGFELKEILKNHLQEHGAVVTDLGANSPAVNGLS